MLGFIDYELLMSYSPQSEYPSNATGEIPYEVAWLGYGLFRDWEFGGAEEDRTPDLLCARQVLSQLSYGPALSRNARARLDRRTGKPKRLVGLDGFEPSTSPLSGVRSNQLSYRPS